MAHDVKSEESDEKSYICQGSLGSPVVGIRFLVHPLYHFHAFRLVAFQLMAVELEKSGSFSWIHSVFSIQVQDNEVTAGSPFSVEVLRCHQGSSKGRGFAEKREPYANHQELELHGARNLQVSARSWPFFRAVQ